MRTFIPAELLAILPLNVAAQAPPSSTVDPSPHRARSVAVTPDVRPEVLDWRGAGEPRVFLTGWGTART